MSRVRMRLEKEADDLCGPRRSASKAFYAAADRFDQAEKRLRGAIVTTDALKSAEQVVAEAQRRLDELHAKHDSIGRDLARRQRALRTRPRLLRIEALRSKLETHADLPPVGADVVETWRSALEEQSQIDFQLAEIDLADAENNTEIAQLAVDEALLAVGPRVDALREKLGAVRKAEEDLPKRNEALRLAREELIKCARRLGLASHEELLTGMPSDIDLTSVRDSIGRRKEAERRLAKAESGLETARLDLQRLERDMGAQCHAADPNPFLRRLDAFTDLPADADRLRRETAAHEAENRRLSEDAAKLDPPAGSPDEFARRPLPHTSQIEAAHQLFAKISDEEKSVAEKVEAANKTLRTIDEELKRLSKAGAVATREDLAKARMRRDREFATLGALLDENPASGRQSLEALRASNAAIDATTDLLLSNADRASRFEAARENLSKERVQQANLVTSQEKIEARRREADTAWLALWARSGINPQAPAIMARWLDRTEDILGRRRRLEDQNIEHEALARKLEEHHGALRRLIEDMGVAADAEVPIEALYKVARATVDRLQVSWAALRERTVLRAKAVEAAKKANATLARIREEVEGFRSSWPKALVAVGLSRDASIVQAEAALTVWHGVPVQKQIFDQEAHRVEAMQSDIAAFERAVTALAREAASDLTALPPRDALDMMSQRLVAARRAHDQRETLRIAGEKRSVWRSALATKRELTVELLKRAREVIGLTEDADLSGAIESLEQRNALADELADVLRDLADIGDNHDELTLREEQRDLDFDILPGEIERLTLGHSELMADIAGAVTALHDARKARDLLVVGRDAESAARDRAEASTELLTIAEHWLARVAAACLAARAIARHRAATQDPLIGRASMLFAIATAGAFAGLGAEYDEADTPESLSDCVPMACMFPSSA
jgi:chromosome segregation protein